MSAIIDRVRLIQTESGLSQRAFAEQIGLDESKLSKALSGKRKFTSLELSLIAMAGGRTIDWVLNGTEPRSWQVAARALVETDLSETGAQVITQAAERFDALADLNLLAPVPALPELNRTGSYVAKATAAAEKARALIGADAHRLSTLALIERVEANLGINVRVTTLPDGCDGLSYQDDRGFRMIVLARTMNFMRQRFTLAHEIGHILAGDATETIEENIDDRNRVADPHTEPRVNTFAAAFLVGADQVEEVLAGRDAIEAFDELCWTFSVTPSSMSWRLLNLKLITAADRSRLGQRSSRQIAETLGKTEEFTQRGQRAWEERRPWLLIEQYINAYRAGHITAHPLAALLDVHADEAREMVASIDADTVEFSDPEF